MPRDEILWPSAPADERGVWKQPPGAPDSRLREVHVWAVPLEAAPEEFDCLTALLSAQELERGARFHFDRDRKRFVVARGTLRAMLAHYLDAAPRKLEFNYGVQGKPALAAPFDRSGLQFNLAHSQNLALVAVTRNVALGVDVERVRPLADAEHLVTRFFSARESAAFKTVPDADRPAAFFNLWTRKEAWLKATGDGIGHLLNQVEVSFLPGAPTRLLGLPPQAAPPGAWSLVELAPAAGFAAALAVATTPIEIQCRLWVHPDG